MTFKLLLLAVLSSLFALVATLPLVVRDVWVPPVTSPDASSVWTAGYNYTITWNTSTKPVNVTNSIGSVFLRRGGRTESTPLNRDGGFPLTDGQVTVTVPANTMPADDWCVVLFGDSGNFSQNFTIVALS